MQYLEGEQAAKYHCCVLLLEGGCSTEIFIKKNTNNSAGIFPAA